MSSILNAHSLIKDYGNKVALCGIDVELPEGKIIGLLGSNGSGKTTFLKLIAGLLTPTSGDLTVAGQPIGIETKKLVSFLPERTYLADWMRVSDILDYFADFYEDFDKEKAVNMLRDLQISESSRFKTLSKGMKEKVQLVLVMSRRAKLYLLDEPIAGVDPVAREYILDTIISAKAPDATILISTHLIADVEKVLDEFIFIREGKIIMAKDTASAKEESGKTLDELFREVYRNVP